MNRLLIFLLVAGCNERPLGPIQGASGPLCQFDAPRDPGRAVMAVIAGKELQLVRADGSHSVAHVFAPEATHVFGQAIQARGGWVAAAASWAPGDDWHQDIVLVDPAGAVRWRSTQQLNGYVYPYLSPDGHLAVALNDRGILVFPDGRERALMGVTPISPVLDGGFVVVRGPSVDNRPGAMSWAQIEGDGLIPTAFPVTDPYGSGMIVAGRLAYVSESEGGAVLVSERPNDVRVVPLPGIDAKTVSITDSVDAGWVLVGDWRTPRYLVNVRTLESRPIGENTPEGFRPFQGALYGPRLDSDGALLMGLRDDYAGALYRAADGRNWTQVGGSVSNVLDIDVLARGGTYLINATSGRYSIEEWAPAPPNRAPDYDRDVLQVVRAESGIAQKLPMSGWVELTNLQLSSDGTCVGYWDGAPDGETTLNAYDVARGRAFVLATAEVASAFAWIE